MIDLDDKKVFLKTAGGIKVLTSISNLQKQIKQSYEESQTVSFPSSYTHIDNVVIAGMGGSRFPPLIVKELFKEELTVPIEIVNDYRLPGFVNEKTLVILSSYSGTTEEVVAIGNKAKKNSALITAITAGGVIGDFLQENHYSGYIFDPIYNPSGQPRIGFGYSVGGYIGLLLKLGLLKIDKQSVQKAIERMPQIISSFTLESPMKKNPAKKLAHQLYNRYPYYLVSEFLTGCANALANQTNETAKSISDFRLIPELNHHLMEGLKFPHELKHLATFVLFYSTLYSSQIKKRFSITKEVIEKNGIETIWHELEGQTKIEQVFEMMGFGSYLTMYLAALYQQDPSLIPYVDYFKKKLKEMKD